MELTRRDAAATVVTGIAVLVFAACQEGWNVPLVGGSERWAAAVILVLGLVGCSLGKQRSGAGGAVLGLIGGASLVFGVLALITGSPTWLSLLTAAFVLLWLASTAQHARPHRVVTT